MVDAMGDERNPAEPPSLMLRLMESRAVFELGAAAAASPFLRAIGRGDQHPVLVLPGFMASDTSTMTLRSTLQAQGYWVHGWRLGRNLGPTERIADGIAERLMEIHHRHGRQVSIVGWSLGGIYARRLAHSFPEHVRQVITLGSPFRINEGDRSAASGMYERLKHTHVILEDDLLAREISEPLPVPSTAIYSRSDGIVQWWQCIESVGPRRENIEVLGSHTGLGHNPSVIYAISDRLRRSPAHWRPFRPPPGTGMWYPKPANWRAPRTTAA